MIDIPIYQSEVEDGLTEKVKASSTLACLAKLCQTSPTAKQVELVRATLTKAGTDEREQWDLFYMNSILVSTGWNRNDDVFDPGEMWAARKSPVHKQVNFMHNEKDIIGNIIASIIVANDKIIDDDAQSVVTPEAYDIVVASVLYRKWEDKDLQKRMDDLIEGIAKGEWYVSMECLLRNFDYAIITPENEYKVVARDAKSAFLTKHLRFYGGTGEYQGNKVGRLLRGFAFSGKGIVTNPANPRSLILTEGVNPFKASSTLSISNPNIEVTKSMADITDTLRDDLAKANARAEKLEQKLDQLVAEARSTEREKFEKQIASQKVDIEDLNKKVSAQQKELSDKDTVIADVQKQLKEVAEVKAGLEKAVAEAKLATVKAERASKLVAVGLDTTKAQEVVTKWATASDEQFADIVVLHQASAKKAEDVEDDPKKGKDQKEDKKQKAGSAEEAEKKKEEEFKSKKKEKADLEEAELEKDVASALEGEPQSAELTKATAAWVGSLFSGTKKTKESK